MKNEQKFEIKLTPDQIRSMNFRKILFGGYNPLDVEDALNKIANYVEELLKEIDRLKKRNSNAPDEILKREIENLKKTKEILKQQYENQIREYEEKLKILRHEIEVYVNLKKEITKELASTLKHIKNLVNHTLKQDEVLSEKLKKLEEKLQKKKERLKKDKFQDIKEENKSITKELESN
ncbi:MAG TPA: DivIVA domain-containing protein [Desulfurobacteriaceae bacterium]|nr:DivIVA domain-containing protein [Desulfurobacteriaceae bacterium]